MRAPRNFKEAAQRSMERWILISEEETCRKMMDKEEKDECALCELQHSRGYDLKDCKKCPLNEDRLLCCQEWRDFEEYAKEDEYEQAQIAALALVKRLTAIAEG